MSCQYEVQLAARPEDVYVALTTPEGIAGWWAKSNWIRHENSIEFLSVDFGQVKKLMRVQRVKPGLGLAWDVLECTLHEWPGTRINFDLAPTSACGCLLKLEHIGLVQQLDCYESCSTGWAHFMSSLKRYVETGKGTPL